MSIDAFALVQNNVIENIGVFNTEDVDALAYFRDIYQAVIDVEGMDPAPTMGWILNDDGATFRAPPHPTLTVDHGTIRPVDSATLTYTNDDLADGTDVTFTVAGVDHVVAMAAHVATFVVVGTTPAAVAVAVSGLGMQITIDPAAPAPG